MNQSELEAKACKARVDVGKPRHVFAFALDWLTGDDTFSDWSVHFVGVALPSSREMVFALTRAILRSTVL